MGLEVLEENKDGNLVSDLLSPSNSPQSPYIYVNRYMCVIRYPSILLANTPHITSHELSNTPWLRELDQAASSK